MRTYTSQPDQTTSAPVHTLDVSLLEPSSQRGPSSRKAPSSQIPRGSRIPSTSTAVEALELELGVELHPLPHPLGDQGVPNNGGLQNRIRSIRRELSHQLGFTIPPVQIQRTLGLPVDAFRINVHGESLVTRKTHGEDIGPSSLVLESLTRVIIDHAYRLLTQDQIDMKIEMLRSTHASRIDGHVPAQLTPRTIHQVACRVLQQHVPVSDFETLILTLIDASDPDLVDDSANDLSRMTRMALRALRGFSPIASEQDPAYGEASVLPVVTLSPALESYLSTEPASKRVCRLIREQFTAHSQTTDHTGQVAALITRSDLQSKMQDIVTLMDRSLKVITWQDVPLHRHVCVLGTIDASSP